MNFAQSARFAPLGVYCGQTIEELFEQRAYRQAYQNFDDAISTIVRSMGLNTRLQSAYAHKVL
jgi:hypothetical protein